MNRLFGTRFDVKASRCTDGLWMALSKIDNKISIIFDCEGLGSLERNIHEEIKLLLYCTAISDVLFLNK